MVLAPSTRPPRHNDYNVLRPSPPNLRISSCPPWEDTSVTLRVHVIHQSVTVFIMMLVIGRKKHSIGTGLSFVPDYFPSVTDHPQDNILFKRTTSCDL